MKEAVGQIPVYIYRFYSLIQSKSDQKKMRLKDDACSHRLVMMA